MRGTSAMKLLAACGLGLLMSTPAYAVRKKIVDRREGNDLGAEGVNCGELSDRVHCPGKDFPFKKDIHTWVHNDT